MKDKPMVVTLTAEETKLLEVAKTLDKTELELLMEKLGELQEVPHNVQAGEEALIAALSGETLSKKEIHELEIKNLIRYFKRRRELLEPSLTAAEIAPLFDTSKQTVLDRLKAKMLIGILDNGAYRFPTWQLDAEGPNGIVDGLPEVLKALTVSDFAKLNWLTRQNRILDDLTPIQALKAGQKDRVVREALAVGTY